ncbi:hypothetical protein ACQRB4_04115 [Peptoniphilaceae bacterium SGI.097]|nr:hypothetical protein [Peptoniphilaceae bacterium]
MKWKQHSGNEVCETTAGLNRIPSIVFSDSRMPQIFRTKSISQGIKKGVSPYGNTPFADRIHAEPA